jgi:transcriptional regulator of acetoin/glycerol metabolism
MYAVLKIEDAAKELGMGTTALKKRCRQYGIHRWPHRQVL